VENVDSLESVIADVITTNLAPSTWLFLCKLALSLNEVENLENTRNQREVKRENYFRNLHKHPRSKNRIVLLSTVNALCYRFIIKIAHWRENRR